MAMRIGARTASSVGTPDETRVTDRGRAAQGKDPFEPSRTLALIRIYQEGKRADVLLHNRPDLSSRQQNALSGQAFRGRLAGEELVRMHYRLIVRFASIFSSSGRDSQLLSKDDLLQMAVLGFLRAIGRFDPRKGTRLSTFVQHAIREEIRLGMRDSAAVSGAHGGDLALRLRHFIRYVEQERGMVDAETVADIANEATIASYTAILKADPRHKDTPGEDLRDIAIVRARERGLWITPEKVHAAMARMQQAESLEAPPRTAEPDAPSLAEQIPGTISPEDQMVKEEEEREYRQIIEERLQCLPISHYSIVKCVYGIGVPVTMTTEEIARASKMPLSEVQTKLSEALALLRRDPVLAKLIERRG